MVKHKHIIAQILPNMHMGGVERCALETSAAIIKSGYKSVIISSYSKVIEELEKMGAEHISIKNLGSKNPLTLYKNINILKDLFSRYNVSVVHARSRSPAWSSYFAAKKLSIPFVTTFHGIYSSNTYINKLYNSVMTKGDKVVAVSNFTKNYILETYNIDKNKLEVIYDGIDTRKFDSKNISKQQINLYRTKYNIKKNHIIILLPSRFSKIKGHSLLNKTLQKFLHLPIQCIYIKDKTSKSYHSTQKFIISSELNKVISIFPKEQNMEILYSLCDIIICPSIKAESFGKSIAEAMAMKKLVISSNIGGPLETIIDKKNGFLFQANDEESLYQVLSKVIEILGTESEKKITNNARHQIITKFDLNKNQLAHIKLYNSLINNV